MYTVAQISISILTFLFIIIAFIYSGLLASYFSAEYRLAAHLVFGLILGGCVFSIMQKIENLLKDKYKK